MHLGAGKGYYQPQRRRRLQDPVPPVAPAAGPQRRKIELPDCGVEIGLNLKLDVIHDA